MKKILFALGILSASFAQAETPELPSCEQSYGVMAAMVVSQAPEEVIRYAVNEILGAKVDDDEKHKIYLDSMRWIHTLRGTQLLGEFGDKNGDDWIKLGHQVLCESPLKVWPYE